jgi:Fe-S cluster biogenesis protein NfuA
MHPRRYPGDPQRLRWLIPAGLLEPAAALTAVPEPLAALRADGTLTDIEVEPGAVVTRLGPGRTWHREGPRIRAALHASLDDPAGWCPAETGPAPDGDDRLRAAARQLLDGPVGEFTGSHGGGIELIEVRGGVVTVRLTGACNGCPAARITLRQRLERQLRQRCPALRAVVAQERVGLFR